MVRIDSTGYSTSSKRGLYSESPIMLGSIGGCELSIPIQESLLHVCVCTHIYIYIFVHACCCLGTSCVQQSSTSAVILIVTAKWVSRVVRPVYRSLTRPFFFSFFFFSLLPPFLPVEITKSRRFHHSSSLLRDQNTAIISTRS